MLYIIVAIEKNQNKTTESVVEHLEGLVEHEVKFIINKVIRSRNTLKSCC